MNLGKPPGDYDTSDQARMRSTLERADSDNIKRNVDLDRLTFRSPDGNRWALSVMNGGIVVANALPALR